jgi:hypothetical protein
MRNLIYLPPNKINIRVNIKRVVKSSKIWDDSSKLVVLWLIEWKPSITNFESSSESTGPRSNSWTQDSPDKKPRVSRHEHHKYISTFFILNTNTYPNSIIIRSKRGINIKFHKPIIGRLRVYLANPKNWLIAYVL